MQGSAFCLATNRAGLEEPCNYVSVTVEMVLENGIWTSDNLMQVVSVLILCKPTQVSRYLESLLTCIGLQRYNFCDD